MDSLDQASTTMKESCTKWQWMRYILRSRCRSILIRVVASQETNSILAQVSTTVNLFYFSIIGPGAYQFQSPFDQNKYVKEMDDKGTYLTLDNGHLN